MIYHPQNDSENFRLSCQHDQSWPWKVSPLFKRSAFKSPAESGGQVFILLLPFSGVCSLQRLNEGKLYSPQALPLPLEAHVPDQTVFCLVLWDREREKIVCKKQISRMFVFREYFLPTPLPISSCIWPAPAPAFKSGWSEDSNSLSFLANWMHILQSTKL